MISQACISFSGVILIPPLLFPGPHLMENSAVSEEAKETHRGGFLDGLSCWVVLGKSRQMGREQVIQCSGKE